MYSLKKISHYLKDSTRIDTFTFQNARIVQGAVFSTLLFIGMISGLFVNQYILSGAVLFYLIALYATNYFLVAKKTKKNRFKIALLKSLSFFTAMVG